MIEATRREHWEVVYRTKSDAGVSWFQKDPRLSLELIRSVAPTRGGRVIDVGGGTSVLVDKLLDLPFAEIVVLDISETALERAKLRLGQRAKRVRWVVADVTAAPDLGTLDVWHDRAVFHFLTDAADRRQYVELARRTVPTDGYLVIATFAEEGPAQCSGLDVCRYNARTMAAELGEDFSPVREAGETHTTPWGSAQPFFYGVFKRR
jgi:ubiquinone/menaquinone biosynthesis C-methylase UbiE